MPILRSRKKPEEPETATEEQWQAIINNDASYNGKFFYAVRSTGIFCYPSCKSRPPKREHVGTYKSAEQALTKFRPCKRCKPTGTRLPHEEWIATVTEYITRNYRDHLSLEHLAEISHGTPYHLHRTFKKVAGVTPTVFIQHVRINHAKQILIETEKSIPEVGELVGLNNAPYFITLFKKMTGTTPEGYRQWHKQMTMEAVEHVKSQSEE
ncbi:bifunctional transcriptional activator/DNA repair enzyme AdaA [Paenibacillus sp. GCM10027627]|uniref:bifunctional transcriptional activator/DNA repair enzyme AdaA n=1 Tax=unclassified Paenibacillus TaxID=185978 RepID=UPI003627FE03